MHSIEYRYFFQAAEDSSIRKASNNLNINSSAIVRQIQKLEQKLNVKLFNRNSKGLELTDEGTYLYQHLSDQNENNKNFMSELKSKQSTTIGEIKISTGETFAVHFLAPIIFKFRFKYPDVKIKALSKQPDHILDDLITNKFDFGISFTRELPRTLEILTEYSFPMGIMCSPLHKLANKKEIFLDDCLEYPMLFHPGTVTFWNKIQREVGIKLYSINPNLIANSLAFIKNYLMEDPSCLTFFTNIGSIKEINNKQLIFRKVNHKLFLNNRVGIIVSKNANPKPYTNYFISLVKEELKKFNNKFNIEKI